MVVEYLFSLIKFHYNRCFCNLEADVSLGKAFNVSV